MSIQAAPLPLVEELAPLELFTTMPGGRDDVVAVTCRPDEVPSLPEFGGRAVHLTLRTDSSSAAPEPRQFAGSLIAAGVTAVDLGDAPFADADLEAAASFLALLGGVGSSGAAVRWTAGPASHWPVDGGLLWQLPAPSDAHPEADAWRRAYRPMLRFWREGLEFVIVYDTLAWPRVTRVTLEGDAAALLRHATVPARIDALPAGMAAELDRLTELGALVRVGPYAVTATHRRLFYPVPFDNLI